MKAVKKKFLKKRILELKTRRFSESEYIPILLEKWANMPIEEYLMDYSVDPPQARGSHMLNFLINQASGHEHMTYLETAARIYHIVEAYGGIERMTDLRRSDQIEDFLYTLAYPLIIEYKKNYKGGHDNAGQTNSIS